MGIKVEIRVELPVELAEHVSHATGEDGSFDSVAAYVAELIRRDMEAVELSVIESHREAVQRAFATPEEAFVSVTAQEVIERNRRRRA